MLKVLLAVSLAIVVQSEQRFECPNEWVSFNLKCYRFLAYPRSNYEGAVSICSDDGASLLSVNSVEEHQFVSNYLEQTFTNRDDWMTSGKVTTSQSGSITWMADGSGSRGFSFWLNETMNQEDGARIIYSYSGNFYGWGITRTTGMMSFICEIPESEAYRIVQKDRDFSYGLATTDPNEVPRGPKFLVEPVETIVLGTTAAVFLECVATAIPIPTYSWKRIIGGTVTDIDQDGSSVYTQTNGKLTINNPSNQDESYYQCQAENNQGIALSRTVQLSFGSMGKFANVAVAEVVAKEHEGAQLNCPPITFKPAAKYQWYKNSIAEFIRPSLQQYIFISNNGKLYFSEITSVDMGSYHCIVSLTSLGGKGNYVGSSVNPSRNSLGFNVKVVTQVAGNYQPIIQDDFIYIFPPQPKRGQDIQMECFAYGTGPLQYTWERLGGKMMPKRARFRDHNRVLEILEVATEDQGQYKCHVSSSKTPESDERSYTLVIQSEPYFTYPLKDQHADKGSRLMWHCEAAGNPTPTYKWYKNGVELVSIPGVLTVRNNALMIESLDPTRDNGMYQCGATNHHATVYSTGQLRVLEFAPTFMKNPLQRGVAGSVGGNVTIVCNPEAAPEPEYEWLKDGRALGLSKGGQTGNHRMLMNGNLYITTLKSGDQGQYTCRVTNTVGQAEDSSILTVVSQTQLTRRPSNEKVLINSTATLVCEASASPNIDLIYSWLFNNHLIDIEKTPHYRLGSGFTRGYLYIINAQFRHDGKYTCNAATGLDIHSADARLTVIGPPGEPAGVFRDAKASDTMANRRSIKLMWTDGEDHGSEILYYDVEFHTNFNLKWRILKSRIPVRLALDDILPTKRQTTLANLKAGAGYQFRVRAMNRFGVGLPSVPTSVIQIPGDKPAKAPQRVGGGGGSVGDLTITWEPLPREDHNGPNLGYKVYWRKKPYGQSESKWEQARVNSATVANYVTLVGDENFYSEYEVQVQAFNDFGLGNRSHIALIRSAEDLPIGTPRGVYADSFNSTSLTVYWKTVLDNKQYMKGKLLGYKVNYWVKGKLEINAIQSIYEGQMASALIIGLMPDTWYSVNVQVYNSAGNGPKSEDYHQSTDRMAPQLYPTEVHVFSYSETQVRVMFRGVSTQVYEEPLQGYKVQYWRMGEDIRKAKFVDCQKSSDAIVGNIDKSVIYQLRIFGYSRGGQGKMSSPVTLFTLGGQVRYDPSTTDIFAGSSNITPTFSIIVTCLLSIYHFMTQSAILV